jgi:hypothetical protein
MFLMPGSRAKVGTPWRSFSPTVTSDSGGGSTVVATGQYRMMGRTVDFTVTVLVSSIGTSSGNMVVTLPVGRAAINAVGVADETALLGAMGYVRIIAGSNTLLSKQSAAGTNTWWTNGYNVIMTGSYERA